MEKPMSRFLPAAAAAGTGIFVGATIVATRFVIDQTEPASLAFLRYAVGFLCLLPPVLLSSRVRFNRRDLLPISLLGIGQFGILVALLNLGLQYIGSAYGALIFSTFPLLTMVIAAGFRQESLTWLKSAGVVLTIAGVGFALGDKLTIPGSSRSEWIGVLAVFGSALCGAICSVFYRPYLRRYPALQVSAFAMLASLIFLALLAVGEGFFSSAPRFTPGGWAAVLFIGMSSAIGYYLWLWALQHASPTKVTIFLALSPITATALGALLLSEDITVYFLIGLGCVAFGLFLANWRVRLADPE